MSEIANKQKNIQFNMKCYKNNQLLKVIHSYFIHRGFQQLKKGFQQSKLGIPTIGEGLPTIKNLCNMLNLQTFKFYY